MRPTLPAVAAALAACVWCGGCRGRAAPDAEPPVLQVTSWTEATELFMEHPPLTAGEHARFAVHLTRLRDFAALSTGRVRLEMTPEGGGPPVVVPGSEPLRPGVFRIEGPMPAGGRYRCAVIVETPDLRDRHDLEPCTVFPDAASAAASAEPAVDPASVSYLKEQQWTTEFATAPVRETELRTAIRVPASIEPLTGGLAIVGAPAAGRFMADPLPSVGDAVRAGQVLGRIEPRLSSDGTDRATLQVGVAEADAAVAAARSELARVERLLAERAVPARRVEDARRALAVAEARLDAAQARLSQRDQTLRSGGGAATGNAFVLRAPIAGRLAEVLAAPGASYDEGTPLFRVVRIDYVEVLAQVPPSDAPLGSVEDLAFEVPGRAEPIALVPDHVHDAGVVDPATRALPVQISVRNPGGRLLVGQTGTAVIYTGGRQRVLAVPASAVLTEAGRPHVFVQTAGESFSRRFIEVAGQDGDLVGVRDGLKAGERVVTRGAYDVRLAAAAGGLPAEGHVH